MKKQIFFFAGWLVLVLCIPLQATEPDQLVGRYYLHGVREVGSELLLKNDGSYAWMLAYGNEDHTSEGRWSRQGNSIVLTAIVPTATGPLFQLDTKKKTAPWSFEAEKALQEQLYVQQRELVLKACPFLDTAEYASAPKMIGEPEPTKAEREQRANEALRVLQKATKALEKAAAAAVQKKTQSTEQQAVEAMDRFQSAWLTAKETHWDAGRSTLKRPVLNLPQMCQLPREPDVKRDKPDSWSKKGIGVVVLDSTSGAPLYRLKLSAVLAEGSKRDAGSSGGVSVIPLFGKEKPVALALTAIRGQVETVDLPTDAVPGRIHRVLVDAARLVPPFFNELRLEIEGNALVWQETGGRYQH